jgi:hypothetical protein
MVKQGYSALNEIFAKIFGDFRPPLAGLFYKKNSGKKLESLTINI